MPVRLFPREHRREGRPLTQAVPTTTDGPMHIPDAKIVSIDEARALIAPVLARHLADRDLQITLDSELMFADES